MRKQGTTTHNIMTLSIMKLSTMSISIMRERKSIMTTSIKDTQHNNAAIVTILGHYPECRILFIVMLTVVMLSAIMLSVMAPNARRIFTVYNLLPYWDAEVNYGHKKGAAQAPGANIDFVQWKTNFFYYGLKLIEAGNQVIIQDHRVKVLKHLLVISRVTRCFC